MSTTWDNSRRNLTGSVLWICCIQYYVVQFLAALAWHLPFSVSQNTISDLGNTACGAYGSRFVCSPDHVAMNTSFAVLGLSMILGSALLYPTFRRQKLMFAGFCGIAAAGLGSMLVGFFPENTVSSLHITGAALSFLLGNVGLVFFGCTSQGTAICRFGFRCHFPYSTRLVYDTSLFGTWHRWHGADCRLSSVVVANYFWHLYASCSS
jgi:hypothetical membrane protein